MAFKVYARYLREGLEQDETSAESTPKCALLPFDIDCNQSEMFEKPVDNVDLHVVLAYGRLARAFLQLQKPERAWQCIQCQINRGGNLSPSNEQISAEIHLTMVEYLKYKGAKSIQVLFCLIL